MMEPGKETSLETGSKKEKVNPEPTEQQFDGDTQAFGEAPTYDTNTEPVTWTASEYVHHDKGAGWFVLFSLVLLVLVGLIYFLSKDILATVLVGVAGLTFGIFAGRPPRVLTYVIDNGGITIGERRHPFSELKSFTFIEENGLPSLMILPLKRFMPPVTVFFDPKDEDKIIDALALRLPHEDKEPDIVDRLMSRIRF